MQEFHSTWLNSEKTCENPTPHSSKTFISPVQLRSQQCVRIIAHRLHRIP